jgi:coenzyme F420-reducing hydrogenase delta subunit/ferredoxin
MSATEATTQSPHATNGRFEPRIVAFVCKWCTYAGADLAGTSRMTYPANVRTIMLPCTGRIDISFVVRAFLQGADGVIVSGCHPGDCHYTAGNFRARRRWMLFRDLLDTLGVDLRRLDLAWISAAEGAKWVKTIQAFTERIRELGPYASMHQLAADRMPTAAPQQREPVLEIADSAPKAAICPADPQLTAAVAGALTNGKAKAVIGWTKSATLGKPRAAWITSAEAAKELIQPGACGNVARLFRNPQLKAVAPIGIIARSSEMLALNVLIQESQIDPKQVLVFGVGPDGRFLGEMDAETASASLLGELLKSLPGDRPVGFSDNILKALDDLMARKPEERWAFWVQQSAKCIKCYACRQSCPMCSCDQCFMEKNQPQWFATSADGPGNFAWHLLRSFHLSGRCVGCGACQDACPAGIPLNLLGAAMARSALRQFEHRAGADPKALPLQSDYRPDDKEEFIL